VQVLLHTENESIIESFNIIDNIADLIEVRDGIERCISQLQMNLI
jgi:hypothetical protein